LVQIAIKSILFRVKIDLLGIPDIYQIFLGAFSCFLLDFYLNFYYPNNNYSNSIILILFDFDLIFIGLFS